MRDVSLHVYEAVCSRCRDTATVKNIFGGKKECVSRKCKCVSGSQRLIFADHRPVINEKDRTTVKCSEEYCPKTAIESVNSWFKEPCTRVFYGQSEKGHSFACQDPTARVTEFFI